MSLVKNQLEQFVEVERGPERDPDLTQRARNALLPAQSFRQGDAVLGGPAGRLEIGAHGRDRITKRGADLLPCRHDTAKRRSHDSTVAALGALDYRPHKGMALKQLLLVVRGRVQGVYFRASAQREARRLGLTGWVKNRSDGSVEIVAEGEEIAIRELYGWAQKGPSAARVERVETRWRSFTGEFPDFRIMD